MWRFATVPGMKAYELALCAGLYVTQISQWPLTPVCGAVPRTGGVAGLSVRCWPALAGSPGLAEVPLFPRLSGSSWVRRLRSAW